MRGINIDEQFTKCVIEAKKLNKTQVNTTILKDTLSKAYNRTYNAICLDIDKTITAEFDGKEMVPQHLCDVLARLLQHSNRICFITGRGENSAKSFLTGLALKIHNQNPSLTFSNFQRISCITNNGVSLFYTIGYEWDDFLQKRYFLIDKEKMSIFESIKSKIREKISIAISKEVDIKTSDIIELSEAKSSKTSLRFPFKTRLIEEKIDKYSNIFNIIEKIINSDFSELNLFVTKGVYEDNTVFEVVLTTKGEAIEKAEKFLGISQNKMLRIGDQGGEQGNDFLMLNSNQGFSVDVFSKNPYVCYPVVANIDGDYKCITGTDGTAFLLSNLRIFPSVYLDKPERDSYEYQLSIAEKKAYIFSKNTISRYSNLVSSWMNADSSENFYTISDLVDLKSGAIKFHDWELFNLKYSNQNHPLFSIFLQNEIDNNILRNLKYATHTDTSLLLRGPENYYYGLCNCVDKEVNKELAIKWSDSISRFFNISIKELKVYSPKFRINNISDRKVLLAVMDSVRNSMLIWLNSLIEEFTQQEYKVVIISKLEECNIIKKCYTLLKKHSWFMYMALFGGLYPFNINQYMVILKQIHSFYNEYRKKLCEWSDETYNYKKGFRVWREIDNFIENTIAVDLALSQYENNLYDLENKKIVAYGIRYGALELPVIADLLYELKGLKYNHSKNSFYCAVASMPSDYIIRHETELIDENNTFEFFPDNVEVEFDNQTIHIIADDNLLTGKTLQIAINAFVSRAILPDKVIIVRYPTLNRISHMFSGEILRAPDTTLFFELIIGLLSSAPYSKLSEPFCFSDKLSDKYKDELGVFNKSRERIVGYLYKNNIYEFGSEVSMKGKEKKKID